MEDSKDDMENDYSLEDEESKLLFEELKNLPQPTLKSEPISLPDPKLLATDKLPEIKQIIDLFERAVLDFYLVNMDAYYGNSISTMNEHEKDWFFGSFPDDNHDTRDYAMWFIRRKDFTSLKGWRMSYNLFVPPKRTTVNYVAVAVLSYCDKLEHEEAIKLPKDKQKYYALILKDTFQKAISGEDVKDILDQKIDISSIYHT